MPKASKKQNDEDVQMVLDTILRDPNIKVSEIANRYFFIAKSSAPNSTLYQINVKQGQSGPAL